MKTDEQFSKDEISEFEKIDLLVTSKLTKALFTTGAVFVGFLYNTELKMFAQAGSNNKWIYASTSQISNALRFDLYADSNRNVIIKANILSAEMFLNWRNKTGAVQLYDTYEKMNLKHWRGTVFKIFSEQQNQFMGNKTDSNNELYYRATVFNSTFEFWYIDEKNLNSEELITYKNYLKNYDRYKRYLVKEKATDGE